MRDAPRSGPPAQRVRRARSGGGQRAEADRPDRAGPHSWISFAEWLIGTVQGSTANLWRTLALVIGVAVAFVLTVGGIVTLLAAALMLIERVLHVPAWPVLGAVASLAGWRGITARFARRKAQR